MIREFFKKAIYKTIELIEKYEYRNFRIGKDLFTDKFKYDLATDFTPEQIYEKATPIGTTIYDKNKVIESYNYLEPRFSLAYQINDDQSIKASYNRIVQYLQLFQSIQLLLL